MERESQSRARSLDWIGRQPSKLDVPGSNPGAPATLFLSEFLTPDLQEILQRPVERLLGILRK